MHETGGRLPLRKNTSMLTREHTDDRYVQPRSRPLAAQRDLGPQSKADSSLRCAPLRMTCHPERSGGVVFLLCRRRSWLLETKLVLLFFAVLVGLSAGSVFAAGAPPARASAASAGAVAAKAIPKNRASRRPPLSRRNTSSRPSPTRSLTPSASRSPIP